MTSLSLSEYFGVPSSGRVVVTVFSSGLEAPVGLERLKCCTFTTRDSGRSDYSVIKFNKKIINI